MLKRLSIIPLLFIGLFFMLSNSCKKDHNGSDPVKVIDPILKIDMVFVQGGTFQMGSNYTQDFDSPIHTVTLSDFYMGKCEVTQAQWAAIMDENYSYFRGDNQPVESISWNEIQEFLILLNSRTGKKYRLPTDAEWEYAARGGIKSKGFIFSGSNTLTDVAWYETNSGITHAVGTKLSNELGLYDMTGNVYEWCNDWYDRFSTNAQTNPTGPSTGVVRINRGGGWSSDPSNSRILRRNFNYPGDRNLGLGFRLSYSIPLSIL